MPQPVRVGERDHAVDVRVVAEHVREQVAAELVGDVRAPRWPSSSPSTGCRCSCAWRRGRRPARCPGRWPDWRRTGSACSLGAERVVAGEVAHLEVVHVDVLAGRDVALGEADDLVVAAHRRAGGDRPRGDLVACGMRSLTMTPRLGRLVPESSSRQRDDDVVVGVQAQVRGNGVLDDGRHGRYLGITATRGQPQADRRNVGHQAQAHEQRDRATAGSPWSCVPRIAWRPAPGRTAPAPWADAAGRS